MSHDKTSSNFPAEKHHLIYVLHDKVAAAVIFPHKSERRCKQFINSLLTGVCTRDIRCSRKSQIKSNRQNFSSKSWKQKSDNLWNHIPKQPILKQTIFILKPNFKKYLLTFKILTSTWNNKSKHSVEPNYIKLDLLI